MESKNKVALALEGKRHSLRWGLGTSLFVRPGSGLPFWLKNERGMILKNREKDWLLLT